MLREACTARAQHARGMRGFCWGFWGEGFYFGWTPLRAVLRMRKVRSLTGDVCARLNKDLRILAPGVGRCVRVAYLSGPLSDVTRPPGERMPTLSFKGKTVIETYHHTVPHHRLEFDAKLSVLPRGQKP